MDRRNFIQPIAVARCLPAIGAAAQKSSVPEIADNREYRNGILERVALTCSQ